MAEISPWVKLAAQWACDSICANLVAIRFRNLGSGAPRNLDVPFGETLNKETGRWKPMLGRIVPEALESVYRRGHGWPVKLGVVEQLTEWALSKLFTELAIEVYGQAPWIRSCRVHVLLEKPWEWPEIYSGEVTKDAHLFHLWGNDAELPPPANFDPKRDGPPWLWGVNPERGSLVRAQERAAYAICHARLRDPEAALGVYLEFAAAVLAPMSNAPGDRWAMSGEQVGEAIEKILQGAGIGGRK